MSPPDTLEIADMRGDLFAKEPAGVARFYVEALGMRAGATDENHAVLERDGFVLIIHRIPDHIASGIDIAQPPVRRESCAVRLDYPVENVDRSRSLARSLGGDIDEVPPVWAAPNTKFYLGYDPEGNVFGVSQREAQRGI